MELFENFATPPKGYGTVPFYWWLGDKLTKERLSYQLDLLEGHHISGLQVNYAHSDKGGRSWGLTYEGDPPIFSDEWWELFTWFTAEAGKRGMYVSLSDYTLLSPGQEKFTDAILKKHPEMTGQLLKCARQAVNKDENVSLTLASSPLCLVIISGGTAAYPEYSFCEDTLSLRTPVSGELLAVYAEPKPFSYNPMHPLSGERMADAFFGEFERRLGAELSRNLNFFFSDELDFGIRGDLWDDFFADEFISRKGYDVRPLLYQLYTGEGDSVKTRLDYYDVVVELEEENYFSKIFDWHEKRGMTYGCDHGGRGYDVVEFGDYMRTQKYNQGPGCDQPRLSSDIVKNKVASSISHLHRRPRVWLEGFYGSGWGTSSEALADAIARNFVMGQSLLSLHGLYYSTHGGWWEWAPPCNCFRMPYWKHMGALLASVERLSYTMTRGVHSCGVGIVYPVDAVHGGLDGELAASTSFGLADRLYSRGIDLDYLDCESIANSEICGSSLAVSGESYAVVVLPEMRSLGSLTYEKLTDAARSGVRIVSIGEPPLYSDRDISGLRTTLLQSCVNIPDVPSAVSYIEKTVRRDVVPEKTAEFYIAHRHVDGENGFDGFDIYMTYGIPRGERCFFRGSGRAVYLNVRDGKKYLIKGAMCANGGITFDMPVGNDEFQVFAIGDIPYDDIISESKAAGSISLSEKWRFRLLPTMDNTFGDFELPPSKGILPCQIKSLMCDGEIEPVTYGAYFLAKEGFESEEEYLEAVKSASLGITDGFSPYKFSMRFGVFDAPGHQGYHGLKGNVSEDFLTIGRKTETQTSEKFVPYDSGFGKVFFTNVCVGEATRARIITGRLLPDVLYVNGSLVTEDYVMLRPGKNIVAAGYRECGRTHLIFAKGDVGEASFPLSMRWYCNDNVLPFDCGDGEAETFYFTSPPALRELVIPCEGSVLSVTVGGRQASVTRSDGAFIAKVSDMIPEPAEVMITVSDAGGRRGGAVFSAPLEAYCGEGVISAMDWSLIDGLRYYSGGAVYSQSVTIENVNSNRRAVLSVDRIVSSAEAFINGQSAGVRFAPPWSWDITKCLRQGENEIRLEVYNTIGNHYEYIPTRYRSGTASGIIGGAKIEFYTSD